MAPPSNQPPPPKRFPWFRTTLVLGGLTAGAIVFARYNPELPWCRAVDTASRPAIEKTCEVGAHAWDWAHAQWTSIGRTPESTAGGSSGSGPTPRSAPGSPQTDPDLPAMTVYFTPTETGSPAALSRMLSTLIRSAEHSVLASYADFDDDEVAQALVAAHKTKGVSVQTGVDNRNCMRPAVQTLIRAGVPVATDRSGAALPANFLVIDGQMVCYGSVTPTFKSLYRDNNCLFAVADRKLAAGFSAYFATLYPESRDVLPARSSGGGIQPSDAMLVVGGLQACLSDDAAISLRVIEAVNGAESSVQVLAPALAGDAIREALANAARRGVNVQVCLDRTAALASDEQLRLKNAGVTLTRTAGPGVLGESVMVIDRRTVVEVNGGWNAAGFAPRRGVGLIMRSPGMAGIFEAEFDRISRHRPAAPNGYAYELLRGHTVAPVLCAPPRK